VAFAPPLAQDLAELLQRARELEALADTMTRRRRAVAGTAALMLAMIDAGWSAASIGRVAGLEGATVRARVRAARQRYDGEVPAIVVDEPLRSSPRLAALRQPLADRQWLSLAEAAEFAGRSVETIRLWRRSGLLPNSRPMTSTWIVYLRADIKRVLASPTNGRRGVDRRALLQSIAQADA
jgi:hypothetical protein